MIMQYEVQLVQSTLQIDILIGYQLVGAINITN